MVIRKYRPEDCPFLSGLFYDTVHYVNAKDYSQEQLNVWADGKVDLEKWNLSFLEHYTLIAETDGVISGFGDIAKGGISGNNESLADPSSCSDSFGSETTGLSGYLDRLYVHKNFQNKGIATAICDGLEKSSGYKRITTHASVTARSFFEKRGYIVLREQLVERGGIFLSNFVMQKLLD